MRPDTRPSRLNTPELIRATTGDAQTSLAPDAATDRVAHPGIAAGLMLADSIAQGCFAAALTAETMKNLLLTATLVRGDRVRSYQIQLTSAGWEAFAREDERTVQERQYNDWHRVEQALARFEHEIAVLRAEGWRDG